MTPSKWKGVSVGEAEDEPLETDTVAQPWDQGSPSSELATEEPVVDDAPSLNPTTEHPISIPRQTQLTPDPPSSPDDEAYLAPGTVLGEYRVEAKIGEGGMGVVYSAAHPVIGKRAAIKVLKAELCRSAFNLERFVDEARIVNQIGHPNIVDVFMFGKTADGRSYFIMEWLKGESLRARVARNRLDLTEICDIVRPLARALEAAHEQGVIHRDLKPDNIFLVDVRGEAPHVKLLDFGIAKLAREEHRMERTATGAMVGTPQYIAPEQAKGYAIDHSVDIYALGGILFELLTGRPPYVADNAMEMVAKHLMEAVPHASEFADVPPELDDLVMRMLAKQPEGRPSLAEVATVIERTSALDRTNVKEQFQRARLFQPAKPPRPVAGGPGVPERPEPVPAKPFQTPPTPTPFAATSAVVMRQSQPARHINTPSRGVLLRQGTPSTSPTLLNAPLTDALVKAMAQPSAALPPVFPPRATSPTEMTATVRATRNSPSKGLLALAVLGALVLGTIAFFVVRKLDGSKSKVENAGTKIQGDNTGLKTDVPKTYVETAAATDGTKGGAKVEGTKGEGTKGDGTKGDGAKGDGAKGDGTRDDATKGDATTGAGPKGAGTKGDGTSATNPKTDNAKPAKAAAVPAQTDNPKIDIAKAAVVPAKTDIAKAAVVPAKTDIAKAAKSGAATSDKTMAKSPAAKTGRLELSISGGKGTPMITIDGKAATTSTELPPGLHSVEITNNGSKPFRTEVAIKEGTTEMRVILEPVAPPAAPLMDPSKDTGIKTGPRKNDIPQRK